MEKPKLPNGSRNGATATARMNGGEAGSNEQLPHYTKEGEGKTVKQTRGPWLTTIGGFSPAQCNAQ